MSIDFDFYKVYNLIPEKHKAFSSSSRLITALFGKKRNMDIKQIRTEHGRTRVVVDGILALLNSPEQLKLGIEERFRTRCSVTLDGSLGATAEFDVDNSLLPSLEHGMRAVVDAIDQAGLLSLTDYFRHRHAA